jgi:hypothetical protein
MRAGHVDNLAMLVALTHVSGLGSSLSVHSAPRAHGAAPGQVGTAMLQTPCGISRAA